MSKTYSQIQQQIESLKKEADKLRQKEVGEVVARIKEAIAAYGLTARDLGLGSAAPRAKGAPAKAAKSSRKKGARAAKFKDEAGNVWGGRGPRPKWLRDAIAAGKSLQDFAV